MLNSFKTFFKSVDKTWLYSSSVNSSTIDYKINIKKAGSLKIKTESKYGIKMKLLSKDKKALTDNITLYSGANEKTLAVKKGTYYIRVIGSSSDLIRIQYIEKALKDEGGASKKAATALTLKKVKQGLVFSEDKTSKADWYKFTLSKATKIDMIFKGNNDSGKVRYELSSNVLGNKLSGNLYFSSSNNYTSSISVKTWTSETIPKGTYYIKIYKDDKFANSVYSVQVKNRK